MAKEILHYRKIKDKRGPYLGLISKMDLLVETVSSFLNCQVQVYFNPRKEFLEKFEINILNNTKRGFYPINDNMVLILCRVFTDNELSTAVGLELEGINPQKYSKLLNLLENILTSCFTNEYPNNFTNCSELFSDDLLKKLMSRYVAKGGYNHLVIRHLIEYFFKMRTTSFEGHYFSTGAIFSKSGDTFDGTFDGKRFGQSKKLSKNFSIKQTNKIDKRVWYLVDGKTSFLLGSKNLTFRNLFTLNEGYAKDNFLDVHSLSLTLKGGDFLIKIESEKLLSIITSDGSEFMFFENKWKYRNYSVLKEVLAKHLVDDSEVINSMLFYILTCSKKQISTILWLPTDPNDIDRYINPATKNKFLNDNLNIKDKESINHIFRCLSSDGVMVINRLGEIEYIGVIVDISKAEVKGIAGTGETAASVLAANGLSLKISQDGLIKIFTSNIQSPIYF